MRKAVPLFFLFLLGCLSVYSQCSINGTVTTTNPTTCGGTNGTIFLPGINGGGTYTQVSYQLNGVTTPATFTVNSSGMTITNLGAGSYTNVGAVYNGGSCSFSLAGPFQITSTPLASISGAATICQNATAPLITFTGSNGTAPYTFTYKINGGADLTVTSTGSTATVAAATTTAGTFVYTLVSVRDATNCLGTASGSATVTVNPTPTVTAVSNQTLCNGSATAAVNFTGGAAGTVYNWTNSNPAIGVAASGTGNIASFTATNSTSAPITSTITVTPVTRGTGFAYIANNLDGTVSVINSATNVVTATIPAGVSPIGVAASADGSKVYVTNNSSGSGSVSVINTATNTVSATIPVGSSPYGVAVSADGSKVYVANSGSNTVSVINTSTNTIAATVTVGTRPRGVVISPDGSKVYVTNDISNTVSVIATATNTVSATIPVGTAPYGVTVSTDGSKVYVANNISNTVSLVNTATNAVTATISVGSGAYGVGLSPDESKLYVTNALSHNVSVVSTATNTVTATIAVGLSPRGISFSQDGTRAYTANSSSSTVSVINTSTNAVTATIAVGTAPFSLGNFIAPALSCSGAPTTFTITVNPTPTVAAIPNQTLCSGAGTTAVNFTGTVTGTTFTWTNSNAAIGLAASGSGNIASFTATNSTASPITSTITVTPSANGCTGTTVTFTITVNPSTVITTQPVSQVVCAGAAASFTVAASGTGTLTYQWRKGGTNITGATSATYTIASATAADAANYDVVVSGTCGTVTSSAVTLTVNPEPLAGFTTTSPGCPGSPITFINTSTISSGTISGYAWNFGDGGTSTATNPTHAYTTPGTYSVQLVATPANGCATSTVTQLVLVQASTLITTQPASQTVCAGAGATFTVVATGTGTLTYQWNKNGSPITGATAATYTIGATTAADAGNFTVTVTGTCGAVTSNAANLTVNAATVITTQPAATQGVCTGAPATFTVTATGAGTLTYQWRKGGTPITGATAATYTIASAGVADAATYTVVVTGTCGSVTSADAVLVVNTATAITTQPVAQSACAGGTATFSVAATGNALTYQWRKDGVAITGATSATYTISPVATTSAGAYSVVVTGSCGTVTSNAVTLTVNAVTAITTQPVAQTVCAGASASFTVAASGTGTLMYQWRKGGVAITGATSTTYSIVNVVPADAALYDVVVTGTCGAVTTTAVALTLQTTGCTTAVPSITQDVQSAVLMPTIARNQTTLRVVVRRTLQINWTVSDAQGKAVLHFSSRALPGSNNDVTIPLHQLSSGIYYLNGSSANGRVETLRIVKP
ncbi:MAG: C-terminal target protein [Flaviaesturariibacter sp.]|nr:C-terminal target protein [Flaviaesturariibacter sp.]